MAIDLALFLFAALALMGSPGPATLSLAGVGASMGIYPARRYLAGIVVGTSTVLVLVASGVAALLFSIPSLVAVVTLAAAAYMLFLAYRIATAPPAAKASVIARAPSFWSGIFLSLANPKAYAAIGAVYSSRTLIQGNLVLDTGAKIIVLAFVIGVVNCAWLLFGSTFSRILQGRRSGRMANLVFAALLILSVAWAFFSN